MLLFRSEEHVDRWCEQWQRPRGGTMTLAQQWQLARTWFDQDRGKPEWRRRTLDEAREVFRSIRLTGEFWEL
jgi:hypothetical protein